MAKGYSKELVGVLDGTVLPANKADGRVYGAKIRRYRATFDFTQATVKGGIADTNSVCIRPAGSAFAGGSVKVSASMGSTTISIGTAASPAKYMALTTFTTADSPVAFGKVSAMTAGVIDTDEEVIITIAAEAEATATLIVDFDTLAR